MVRPVRMKAAVHLAFSTLIVFAPAALVGQAPSQRQQPEFIKQGQQLMREGKMEEALALIARLSNPRRIRFLPTSLPGVCWI